MICILFKRVSFIGALFLCLSVHPLQAANGRLDEGDLNGAVSSGATEPEPAEHSSSTRLKETLVTATRSEKDPLDVPASTEIIDSMDIQARGIVTASDVLEGVAGLFVQGRQSGDGFDGIRARGLPQNHGNDLVLGLLDGLPIMSANEELVFNQIPFNAVDRVEVVRGPSSALYGRGSVGGVINYRLKSPVDVDGAQLRLGLAGYDQYRVHGTLASAHPNADESGWLLDASWLHDDGWRDHNTHESGHALLKWVGQMSDQDQVSAYLSAYHDSKLPAPVVALDANGEPVLGAFGRRDFYGYRTNGSDQESYFAALRWQHKFSDDMSWQNTLHVRQSNHANELAFSDSWSTNVANGILGQNGFRNQVDATTWVLESQLHWHVGNHDLTAGMSFDRSHYRETDWWSGENGFNTETYLYHFFSIRTNLMNGQIVNRDSAFWVDDLLQYQGEATSQFFALYLQDDWQINEQWSLIWGARWDGFDRDVHIDSDRDGDGVLEVNPNIKGSANHISPKAAISYALDEHARMYLSYGVGFNANFGPIWQWDPAQYTRGEDIKPLVASSWELGYKARLLDERLELNAALYQMRVEDMLVFVPNPEGYGPSRAMNADQLTSRGVELSMKAWLGAQDTLAVSATWGRAVWDEYSVSGVNYAGKEVVGNPRTMLSLHWDHEFNNQWQSFVRVNHNSDYAITYDNSIRKGASTRVDMGLAWTPTQTGALSELRLNVSNVLNDKNWFYSGTTQPTFALPLAPRNYLLTATFDF